MRSLAHLSISLITNPSGADQYSIHFSGPGPEGSAQQDELLSPVALHEVIPVDTNLRTQIEEELDALSARLMAYHGHGSGNSLDDRLRTLGRLLYRFLLPTSIQRVLDALPPACPLVITTNDSSRPWELLHNEKTFLILDRPVSRRFATGEHLILSRRPAGVERSLLLISDPRDDLAEADVEARMLLDLFDRDGRVRARILGGANATRFSVLEALGKGEYDFIHYSGHAAPGVLKLADGDLTAAEIRTALNGHPFVFLNACQSDRHDAKSQSAQRERDALPLAGLATGTLSAAFLLGGATGFIGTIWKVFDRSSREMAEWFYAHLLNGDRLGLALHAARTQLRQAAPTDPLWASYTLYGDPDLRLVPQTARRKHPLTSLVVHMDGLLSLYTSQELEQAAAQEAALENRQRKAAARYGGDWERRGDGALVLRFGLLHSREDDSVRALRAAHALQQCVQVAAAGKSEISLRMGIASGDVLIQPDPYTETENAYSVFGDVEMRAAALANSAEPGQIRVDDRTRCQSATIFAFEGLELEPSVDFAQEVFVVLGEISLDLPRTRMVGREREQQQILDLWREALRGRGRMILVEGVAGVGKSRLVQAVRETLTREEQNDRSPNWIQASVQAYDRLQPHALIGQIVEALAGFAAEDKDEERLTKLKALVDEIAPGSGAKHGQNVHMGVGVLAGMVGLTYAAAEAAALTPKDRQSLRAQLLTRLLQHTATDRPVVLHLEDIQWTDEASRSLLVSVSQKLGRMPLLILATSRPDEDLDMGQFDNRTTLTLHDLDSDAQRALVANLLGDDALPPELLNRILQRTRGNPLFIREMIRSMQEQKLLVRSGSGWRLTVAADAVVVPETVEQVIQDRLRYVPPEEQETLDTAAVIGDEFEREVLAQAQDRPGQARLNEDLHNLTRRNLIVEAENDDWLAPPEAYRFSHGLIRGTIYDNLIKPFRRRMHRLVAGILRQIHGDDAPVARLAQHYYYAEDRTNAVRYCLRAAASAAAEWDNLTAQVNYIRVLETLNSFDVMPPTPEEVADGMGAAQLLAWRVEALAGEAEVLAVTGRNDDAIQHYAQILAQAPQIDDFGPADVAQVYYRKGSAHQHSGDFDAAQAAFNQGFALLEGDDDPAARPVTGRLHVWTGFIHFKQGRLEEGLAACNQGIQVLTDAGSDQDLAQAYNLRGILFRHMARYQEALDSFARSEEVYKRERYLPGLVRVYNNRGSLYQDTGPWNRALADFQRGGELAERIGEIWWQAGSLINQGEIYRRQGQLEQAIRVNQQALRLGQDYDLAETVGLTHMNLGAVYLQDKTWDKAQTHLTTAEALFADVDAIGHRSEVLCYLAEMTLAQGELARGEQHAIAAQRATNPDKPLQVGRTERVWGRLHLKQGALDQAKERLALSLEALVDNPYEQALTRLVLAELYRAEGEQRVAVEQAQQAARIFRQFGADGNLEQAEQLLVERK